MNSNTNKRLSGCIAYMMRRTVHMIYLTEGHIRVYSSNTHLSSRTLGSSMSILRKQSLSDRNSFCMQYRYLEKLNITDKTYLNIFGIRPFEENTHFDMRDTCLGHWDNTLCNFQHKACIGCSRVKILDCMKYTLTCRHILHNQRDIVRGQNH
jgi:hypothetical protein